MDQKKEAKQDLTDNQLKDLVTILYVRKGTQAYKIKEVESDIGLVKISDVEKIFQAFKDKIKELSKKRIRWYKVALFITVGLLIGIALGFIIGYYAF